MILKYELHNLLVQVADVLQIWIKLLTMSQSTTDIGLLHTLRLTNSKLTSQELKALQELKHRDLALSVN